MLRDYWRDLLSLRGWVVNAVMTAAFALVWWALKFVWRLLANRVRIHRLPPVVSNGTSSARALPFDDGGTVYLRLTPGSA